MKRVYGCMLLVALCLPMTAAASNYPVESLTPGGPLTSLAVDDDHVWIGSFGGLYRFDKASYSCEVLAFTPDFPVGNISAVTVTPDGRVWAASVGKGLVYSGADGWTSIDFNDNFTGAFAAYANTVMAVTWYKNMVHRVLTFGETLTGDIRFDHTLPSSPDPGIRELLAVSDSSFYLLDDAYFSLYADSTMTDLAYPENAWDIAWYGDSVWAVAPQGVSYFDGGIWIPIPFPELFPTDDVWSIETDAAGKLWLLSRHGCVATRENGGWSVLSSSREDTVLLESISPPPTDMGKCMRYRP